MMTILIDKHHNYFLMLIRNRKLLLRCCYLMFLFFMAYDGSHLEFPINMKQFFFKSYQYINLRTISTYHH